MTTPLAKTTPASEKKDVQKLQRAIVDGLEDVKAQDIQVFDTEQVTALFERVIIASGTSNRQTKALAASVRDSVRKAGFATPRTEGEDNGEWIIVDCGAAVAHIMQPVIRQYYHLEELWGDKPVKLKLGAAAPAARRSSRTGSVGDTTGKPAVKKAAAGKTAARKTPAGTAAKSSPKSAAAGSAKTSVKGLVRSTAKKVADPVARPAVKKAPARKTPARAPAKSR